MTYIQPFFPILLAITVAACLYRKPRSRFLSLAVIALFLFSWPPAAHFAVRPLESKYRIQPPADRGVEAIVVLSSSVLNEDPATPSPILGGDTYQRCLYAAWLYRNWLPVPVLASGGGSSGTPYAVPMSDEIRRQGVPEAMVWTEERSHSTYENALYSADLLRKKNIHRVALVTEAYHMERAARTFRKQGIEVVPAACGFRGDFEQSLDDFLPSWQAVSWNEETMHEMIALLWYRLRGWS